MVRAARTRALLAFDRLAWRVVAAMSTANRS
jgi:hypothetical protein